MSTSSVIGQIKQTVIDRVRGAIDLTEVEASIAPPANPTRQCIYFAGSSSTTDVQMLGRDRTFDDTVTLTLVIDSRPPGGTPEEVDATSDALFSAVRLLLFDQVTVSSLSDTEGKATVTSMSTTTGNNPEVEGYVGAIVVQITYDVLLDN